VRTLEGGGVTAGGVAAAATPGPGAHAEAGPGDLLRLEGLEVHFPIRGGLGRRGKVVRAVDGIDLSVRRGEVLGLVGESGSGKTTTGRVISKLTRQTAGRIIFEGQDVSKAWGRDLAGYRRRVGMIFQDPYETLNPKQSIFDFVAEPLVVNRIGKPGAERRQRVHAALESAGLRPARAFASRFPHELSGGQRQRVVIAGALVLGPELVVADEPVSMLDVSIRTELLRLMLDVRAERSLTYLFITHDLALAWVLADRVAVMYLGRIMEIGPASDVISTPRHPYTAALISVAPSPEPPAAGERTKRTILVGETPDASAVPTGCRFRTRCPLVFEKCLEEPPLIQVGDGHAAACWLAQTEAPTALAVGDVELPGALAVPAVEPKPAARPTTPPYSG
jgi:oligopeptide/dipeptide ABC transporter ATP-binding protein